MKHHKVTEYPSHIRSVESIIKQKPKWSPTYPAHITKYPHFNGRVNCENRVQVRKQNSTKNVSLLCRWFNYRPSAYAERRQETSNSVCYVIPINDSVHFWLFRNSGVRNIVRCWTRRKVLSGCAAETTNVASRTSNCVFH